MKKTTTILLLLAMLVGNLAACSETEVETQGHHSRYHR